MGKKIGQSWLDKLDNLVAENSKLSLFLLIQIVIITLLVIGYMKLIDKIEVSVELPTIIKEEGYIYVGKEHASESFFKMWGREDIEQVSTFNQKDIKNKVEYLKNRMYPPVYYKYETLLKEYEAQISSNLVSQKFTFGRENIVAQVSETNREAVVSVEGFYSKFMDEEEVIQAQACKYEFGYKIEEGHIYVNSFKTTCK